MTRSSDRVFIGLGSNLGDPEATVRAGVDAIAALDRVRLVQVSSLYRSAPVGFAAQPDFVNAVAEIRTALSPLHLLQALQAIEHRHGRVREFRNGPRTLDLDLLVFGELRLHVEGLVVPHPRAHERAFVLRPLAEIAPDCVIPGQGAVAELAARCRDQSVTRIGSAGGASGYTPALARPDQAVPGAHAELP